MSLTQYDILARLTFGKLYLTVRGKILEEEISVCVSVAVSWVSNVCSRIGVCVTVSSRVLECVFVRAHGYKRLSSCLSNELISGLACH